MNKLSLIIAFLLLTSCTPESTGLLAVKSLQEEQIFCNPFKENGFEGVLTLPTSHQDAQINSDSILLQFDNIPDLFETDRESYIQLRAVNYISNRQTISESPLDMNYYNHQNNVTSLRDNYIDHQHIQNSGLSIGQFFSDYTFIIQDVGGWQSILIGLFNVSDHLVAQAQTLIPPFEVNPHKYKTNNSENPRLYQLHPFFNFIKTSQPEDTNLFLSKVQETCR